MNTLPLKREALQKVLTWAEQRCPCVNDEPRICPLCQADVAKDGCLSAENTIPRSLLNDIRAALSSMREVGVMTDGQEAVAYQWRKVERAMKHEELWSYVDYHTGLKIKEYPEKYEVRALGVIAEALASPPPVAEGEAIADAVLAWMVKFDLLDAGNEYHASDVVAVLNDLAPMAAGVTMRPCEKHPERYCNCQSFYPACREWPATGSAVT